MKFKHKRAMTVLRLPALVAQHLDVGGVLLLWTISSHHLFFIKVQTLNKQIRFYFTLIAYEKVFQVNAWQVFPALSHWKLLKVHCVLWCFGVLVHKRLTFFVWKLFTWPASDGLRMTSSVLERRTAVPLPSNSFSYCLWSIPNTCAENGL